MGIGTITTHQAICVDFLVTIKIPMDVCGIGIFFLANTNLKVEKFHVEPAGKYLLECILVKVTFITVIDTLLLLAMSTLLLASRDHLQQLGWVSLVLTICLLEASPQAQSKNCYYYRSVESEKSNRLRSGSGEVLSWKCRPPKCFSTIGNG